MIPVAVPTALVPIVFAGTGHRPQKLSRDGLSGFSAPVTNRLRQIAYKALVHHDPSQVISGLAVGWDLALAEAALLLRIPVIGAMPCDGQENRWPKEGKERYWRTLDLIRAQETAGLEKNGYRAGIHQVCEGGYAHYKMLRRDEWMVDQMKAAMDRGHAAGMIALWNGNRDGGTAHTVFDAAAKDVPVFNLWKPWLSDDHPLPALPPAMAARLSAAAGAPPAVQPSL